MFNVTLDWPVHLVVQYQWNSSIRKISKWANVEAHVRSASGCCYAVLPKMLIIDALIIS